MTRSVWPPQEGQCTRRLAVAGRGPAHPLPHPRTGTVPEGPGCCCPLEHCPHFHLCCNRQSRCQLQGQQRQRGFPQPTVPPQPRREGPTHRHGPHCTHGSGPRRLGGTLPRKPSSREGNMGQSQAQKPQATCPAQRREVQEGPCSSGWEDTSGLAVRGPQAQFPWLPGGLGVSVGRELREGGSVLQGRPLLTTHRSTDELQALGAGSPGKEWRL